MWVRPGFSFKLDHPTPPWRPALQALKPEYAKAATALKDYSSDVIIAKVICSKMLLLTHSFTA